MASLSLRNICKVYPNGFCAVKDFNLEIKDKEFIIFVGPSGCGKSTTLRMIAGLEEISSGELYIGDKLVNDVEPKDRDIAMVFQNYALYPHMTVYDNMAFGLKLRKVPKAEQERLVKDAAKILDLEQLLDRKPKALSGGQRQRVAMGRAIVRNPKVFLMDEPLSNLDAKLRVQMRVEIAKIHKRLGATIIYVTHDQTEAMTLGTRIVVMKDGVVQQVDSPKLNRKVLTLSSTLDRLEHTLQYQLNRLEGLLTVVMLVRQLLWVSDQKMFMMKKASSKCHLIVHLRQQSEFTNYLVLKYTYTLTLKDSIVQQELMLVQQLDLVMKLLWQWILQNFTSLIRIQKKLSQTNIYIYQKTARFGQSFLLNKKFLWNFY